MAYCNFTFCSETWERSNNAYSRNTFSTICHTSVTALKSRYTPRLPDTLLRKAVHKPLSLPLPLRSIDCRWKLHIMIYRSHMLSWDANLNDLQVL